MGRFIALPAAIFRPSFLPFGQTGTRCFRVQSLSFDYRHSILLCVDSPEASKLSSGLVKKLRQASTVYIFSETIMKRNRATSTVLFVLSQSKYGLLEPKKHVILMIFFIKIEVFARLTDQDICVSKQSNKPILAKNSNKVFQQTNLKPLKQLASNTTFWCKVAYIKYTRFHTSMKVYSCVYLMYAPQEGQFFSRPIRD